MVFAQHFSQAVIRMKEGVKGAGQSATRPPAIPPCHVVKARLSWSGRPSLLPALLKHLSSGARMDAIIRTYRLCLTPPVAN
jgi:hypothetical protein